MAEVQKEIELEIAHVLLIENVGYSKLPTKEQPEALQELNSPAFGLVSFAAKPPSCASGSRGRTNVVPPSGDFFALQEGTLLRAEMIRRLENNLRVFLRHYRERDRSLIT